MQRHTTTLSTLICLFLPFAAHPQNVPPGRVSFSRMSTPALDSYTTNPTTAQQQWFQTHFNRMVVFSTYFDLKTSWYPNAQVYQDLYAIYPNSDVATQHPEWILHDQAGNRLFIPWGCANGTCPQYAGDVANPNFRAWWISQLQTVFSRGSYKGVFIDDVNMNFSVSDGNGNQVAPIDDSTGAPMTWSAWRNYIAQFVMQIRQAFPGKEIVHNSVWFAGPDGVRDLDPAIKLQISAADIINLERGIGSDAGLTGGTGAWSLYSLFTFIDHVHQSGHAGVLEQYDVTDLATQQYSLAGYFLISSGRDYYSDTSTTPDNWWSGFDIDIGAPLGPRTYANGVYQRNFTNGIVLLNDPNNTPQTITLPGSFQTLDGSTVTSVTISGKQGVILRGPYAAAVVPALSVDTTSLPAATAGSFYNLGLQASGGSGTYAFSLAGGPSGLSTNGWNLAGIPAAAGTYSVVITAADAVTGATAQETFSLTVNQPLSISTSTFAPGAVGTPYTASITGSGGSQTYIWSIVNQPTPLAITGNKLAGTPTAVGTSPNLIVTVMDTATAISVQKSYSMSVLSAPLINVTSLPAGIMNVPYTASLTASGGSGSYSWSATGLPPGILVSGSALTGTPSKTGTWDAVGITVKDKTTGATAYKTFSIKIAAKPSK